MNMKRHILAALREKYEDWESLLKGLSEEQANAPLYPSDWGIKDVVAHLMAWQQRSIARVEAARLGREPQFPDWPSGVDPDAEGSTDQINAWIYANYRDRPWADIYRMWREGFLRFLEESERITEIELLDSSRYPWLGGYPLALILIASYDHHQEHYEKLLDWMRRRGRAIRAC